MSRREMIIKRKAQQTMRRRIAVIIVTICIMICGVLTGSGIMAAGKSKASDVQTSVKYYTSIRIEQGDSLWNIACTHMGEEYDSVLEYIAEVRELNGLRSDDIHSGQYLTIPYYQ